MSPDVPAFKVRVFTSDLCIRKGAKSFNLAQGHVKGKSSPGMIDTLTKQ